MPVVRSLPAAALLAIPLLTAGLFFLPSHQATSSSAPDRAAPGAKAAGGIDVEIRCMDESVLRVKMPNTKLEFVTEYGALHIPVADVRRIEFAMRTPGADAEKIALAASKLGHADFDIRERATEELKAYRDRAYPTVAKLLTSEDAEVGRRAEEIVKFIEAKVPAGSLEPREHDVVHTKHSKIAGRLSAGTLTVVTSMFGEQALKLSDVRTLRSGHELVEEAENTVIAPGTMDPYGGQYGKVFTFKLTAWGGPPHPQGSVWGTDVYTLDSSLPAAAVHAGVLKPGQTGTVRVRIIQSPPQFVAGARNGVNSAAYGVYSTGGYEFVRK